jgi:hypothetical protein
MSALAYGREDWYSAPGWYYWFAFQAACAMAALGRGTMAVIPKSFVAIGGCHHRTNGHAEGRASQRRSATRAQAADHSMLSHRRVVAIASDSAFSLPALLGRGSLASRGISLIPRARVRA